MHWYRRSSSTLAFAAAIAALSCSDEVSNLPADGGLGGQAGAAGAGGAAGGCSPGERPLANGDCQSAGIPPELCGTGFAADGDGGCVAVLPEDDCEPGLMALPGETTCRLVAPCGDPPWGDIPLAGESNAQFVDGSYAGGDSDGTAAKPWTTIQEGVEAAEHGAVVAVAAGTYPEWVRITYRAVRLWGRCPSMVHIQGDPYAIVIGADQPGVDVQGTEIHGVAMTSVDAGCMVSNALDVVLDRVWIHDTGDMGLGGALAWGPTSLTVSRSLFEGNVGMAISVASTPLDVSETVIRDAVDGQIGEGRGVSAERITAGGSMAMSLRSSVIERTSGVAVAIAGIEATIEDTLIRSTRPEQPTLALGRAMTIQDTPAPDAARADVIIQRSVIANNHDVGVFIMGSDALIEHTVIRDTRPRASDDEFGVGMAIEYNPWFTHEVGRVILRESLVDSSHDSGIAVMASELQAESVILRNTKPNAADGFRGLGMVVSNDVTQPPGSSPGGVASVLWSRLENHRVAGLSVFNGEVTVSDTFVGGTMPMADGRFGDGLIVLATGATAALNVTACRVEDNARAGVANFSAVTRVGQSSLSCNTFHLDGELFDGPFTFENQGGNACGCDGQTEECRVVSSNLEAPTGPGP